VTPHQRDGRAGPASGCGSRGPLGFPLFVRGRQSRLFLLCRLRKGYSWSKPLLTQRSRNVTAEIHATIHGMARSSESVPPSNAMKSRLVIGVHRRYRPRTDTEPRHLCARHSPGERGKTKPLGAALALKAAGTAFHRCPEACRLQSDDRTHLTSTQINLAYPPCPAGPAHREGNTARNGGIIGADVRPNRGSGNHCPEPRATRSQRPRGV
jgi:hypothetical protein